MSIVTAPRPALVEERLAGRLLGLAFAAVVVVFLVALLAL